MHTAEVTLSSRQLASIKKLKEGNADQDELFASINVEVEEKHQVECIGKSELVPTNNGSHDKEPSSSHICTSENGAASMNPAICKPSFDGTNEQNGSAVGFEVNAHANNLDIEGDQKVSFDSNQIHGESLDIARAVTNQESATMVSLTDPVEKLSVSSLKVEEEGMKFDNKSERDMLDTESQKEGYSEVVNRCGNYGGKEAVSSEMRSRENEVKNVILSEINEASCLPSNRIIDMDVMDETREKVDLGGRQRGRKRKKKRKHFAPVGKSKKMTKQIAGTAKSEKERGAKLGKGERQGEVDAVLSGIHRPTNEVLRGGEFSDDNTVGSGKKLVGFDTEEGGAVWDIFRRQDIPRLQEYLRKHHREFRHIHCSPVEQVKTPHSIYTSNCILLKL